MKRVPRLLLVAFALSLLVHLIVAGILRPPASTPEGQAEVVSIQHRPATIALRRPPTPPPRLVPTPQPRASSSAPPVGKGPGKPAKSGSRAPTPAPVVARATPQPLAPPTACAHSDVAAAVTTSPTPPDIPAAARTSATNATALVSVQLDAAGQVTNTTVTQSTGNSSLDVAAVAMARDAQYSPALRDCKPVAGAYTFSVKFVAW